MEKTMLALVAHDSKKGDMVCLVKAHQRELSQMELIATKGTGKLIKAETGQMVTLLEDGPYGGDRQVGALVASGKVGAVVFLRDPLMAQPHEPDISALLRVCDVHNVPLATNVASAEGILHQICDHPQIPDELYVMEQFLQESEMAS
ncbi:MAG: methylglyoxal synthase [Chloroflexota bacterium]|nr:methylglyoxal synthase [Chloroflexota bacterium]